MKRRLAFFVCLLIPLALSAQSQRTFVASTGNDANPCSRVSPCRNFAAAVAATIAGGEVVVLDSAGYGAVTVSNSVSIVAPEGVYAGITAFSGAGITVTANGEIVTLHGLTVNSLGGTQGINATAVAVLHIDNCTVSGFIASGNAGLQVAASQATMVSIRSSRFRDNYSGAIFVGSSTGTIDHSDFDHNILQALEFAGSASFTVRDTTLTQGQTGVFAATASQVALQNCMIANVAYGIVLDASASPKVSISGVIVSETFQPYKIFSGEIDSFGNNQIVFYSTAPVGTLTGVSQQ